ncbi:2-hydroxychromene-2-carboxylate isomerase, partial [Leptospira yasudae]
NKEVQILWRPFLLGPIFKEQGWNDSPFNIYPSKGKYMWKDLERRSRKYGIPFEIPSQFPRNGLLASRVAVANSEAPWISSFIRKTFSANFAKDLDISKPEILIPILDELKLDGTKIIEDTQKEGVKNLLRKQTERAIELGIFGAPSFVIGEELFWGDDRLEDALEELQRI